MARRFVRQSFVYYFDAQYAFLLAGIVTNQQIGAGACDEPLWSGANVEFLHNRAVCIAKFQGRTTDIWINHLPEAKPHRSLVRVWCVEIKLHW